MKRAALALRRLFVEDIDIEGGLVLVGAVTLSIAAGGLAHDVFAGLAVFGGICLAAGIALARPRRAA